MRLDVKDDGKLKYKCCTSTVRYPDYVLENRSCSLGIEALKSSIMSDPSIFLKNKTAPTSPVDLPSLLNLNSNSIFKDPLLFDTSQHNVEKSTMQSNNENSIAEMKNRVENANSTKKCEDVKVNSEPVKLPQEELSSQTSEMNVISDNLPPTSSCGKISQRKRRKSQCCIG